MVLEPPPNVSASLLARAVAAVVAHHDALRLRFHRDNGSWRQEHAAPPARAGLCQVDHRALPPRRRAAAGRRAAAAAQASLALDEGPLVRVVLFDDGSERRLLLIAHHLVVDAISWRILIEDLEEAHRGLAAGAPVLLPPKTDSYKRWAERLAELTGSDEIRADLAYWSAGSRRQVAPLPRDREGANLESSLEQVEASLDRDETAALLRDVPATYGNRVHEVVLAAVLGACRLWTGRHRLLVDLEGHGRDALDGTVDLSRTVGWFTSLYPVLFELPPAGTGPANLLTAVKEQVRRVPRGGLSWGVLRYLGPEETVSSLAELPEPEIAFLYLGQLEADGGAGAGFRLLAEPAGPSQAPASRRTHLIEVKVAIHEGRLRAGFAYSRAVHRRATLERLAQDSLAILRELIDHCRNAEGGYTPSDFSHLQLRQDELDDLLGELADHRG
jgi:non-ribosomal peptide synthase protein (TIGR01720 family)